MNKLEKAIYFNVYKNESDNPKAPTYSWKKWTAKEDIVIKAGTVCDITFWGNSINKKDGKPNPHLRISNHEPRDEKDGASNKGVNYSTKQEASQRDQNYLDDEITF